MTDDEIFYGKPGVTYHGLNGSVTIPTTQPTDNAGLIERLVAYRDIPPHYLLPAKQNDLCIEAAAALATKDAEIADLRELVRRAQENTPEFYVNWHSDARAALGAKL